MKITTQRKKLKKIIKRKQSRSRIKKNKINRLIKRWKMKIFKMMKKKLNKRRFRIFAWFASCNLNFAVAAANLFDTAAKRAKLNIDLNTKKFAKKFKNKIWKKRRNWNCWNKNRKLNSSIGSQIWKNAEKEIFLKF